ncbi:MAG: divalent-cation tolerance protein CutA [Cyanobium sp.]
MSLIAVFTTLPSREQALDLARALVQEGLVACAQISAIESVYVWQGDLQQEPEFRLLLKACASRYDAIEAAILARHPYDLPAIHAQAVVRVHEPYGTWIRSRSGATAPESGQEPPDPEPPLAG